MPSFTKEYERFWDGRSRASGQHLTQSTPLILAALYAGAIVCPVQLFQEHFNVEGREDLVSRFYLIASQSLRICNFPRVPTVEALSAYMILLDLTMREEEPLTTASDNVGSPHQSRRVSRHWLSWDPNLDPQPRLSGIKLHLARSNSRGSASEYHTLSPMSASMRPQSGKRTDIRD